MEILLLDARISAVEKTEAWKAFAASQGSDDGIDIEGFKLAFLVYVWARASGTAQAEF